MIVVLLHALSLAVTPLLSFGPFKIFVLSQSMQYCWRHALRLALTPLVADIPVIVAVWLLLRQLPAKAIQVLQIAGGIFFINLAAVIYRKVRLAQISAESLAAAPDHSFRQAVLSIWIIPHIYINWALFGVPARLAYSDQSIGHALAFLAFFYCLWIGGLALQNVVVGRLGTINQRANAVVITLASLFLAGFGIYQVWTGATALPG